MTAIVLDTETTGLSKNNDRVVEIAILGWRDPIEYHTYFDPEMPMPPEVSKINGITDEMLIGAPKFSERAEEIYRLIANAEAVIGQNPWFDQDMIDAEFARCGLTIPKWPTLVCTKRTWDVHEPPHERHLMNAYKRFVDRKGFENAHSAMADTKATRDVLRGQINVFDLSDTSWEDFDPERKLWWGPSHHILIVDQTVMMNFGKHRGKAVRDVDHGFWRWLLERDFPKHILMLALEATKLIEKGMSRDVADIHLYTWAQEHAKEHFR